MLAMFTKRKLLAGATALSLVTLIVGSTFTWTSLNSQRLNEWRGTSSSEGPGGSLHDDHDNNTPNDPHKDVYIENWGDNLLVARIKLSEYMETGDKNSNAGSIDNTTLVRNANDTATSLLPNTISPDNKIIFTTHIPAASVADCGLDFHTYWNWAMGGSKYYMPASSGDIAAAKASNSSILTDITGYDANSAGAKQTLDCSVITMADYLALPAASQLANNYWIMDTDGWAYWSQLIAPGTATGLLLHTVDRTSEPIDGMYYYAINVKAQMADLTGLYGILKANASNSNTNALTASVTSALTSTPIPDDFTDWITGAAGTEKATTDAANLLGKLFVNAVASGDLAGIDQGQAQTAVNALIGQ